MEHLIRSQIQDRSRLETSALRLQRQSAENELALRQAKYDLRAAQQEQTLYSSSFRSFIDHLSGKKEAAETALRHAVQKAEADLASAQQQQEALGRQLQEIRTQLESLPSWEALKDRASAFSDTVREWNRLEALYCTEALTPLLEDNRIALQELRNMMSGSNAGKVYSFAEQAEIQTAPEQRGEACKPFILRLDAALNGLDLPFGPIDYFEAPTAYVISAAANHNRRDRLNKALNQVESIQKQISRLRTQLH